MSYHWATKEFQILKNKYGKIKIEELEKLLPDRTRGAIQKKAQLLGIHGNPHLASKKYTIDYNFFDKPNRKNSYWAGFIAADGGLYRKKANKNDKGLTISLSIKDKVILQEFIKVVKYNGPIKYFEWQGHKYCKISIFGVGRWHNKLKKHWNITPNKSLTLRPPNLTKTEYIFRFIIGYIDGDGSIYHTKGKNRPVLSFSVCGTEYIVRWIANKLYTLENQSKYIPYTIINNGHSPTNKVIRCSSVRAKTLLSQLDKVPVDFKLARKWGKIYEPTERYDKK